MTPIQQLMLGAGGAKKKVYMDDVFSTDLYKGNATGSGSQSINNGIDLAGEGGLTWIKRRSGAWQNYLMDTVRGASKAINSDDDDLETTMATGITSFNNNGFSLGAETQTNYLGEDFVSWSFRKAPGFFDVVTYTGNGTAGKTVSHSLGSIPGMILIKNLSLGQNWRVYHRSIGAEKNLILNLNNTVATSTTRFNDTEPTASEFTVGTNDGVNKNGDDFIAYVFAGGDNPADTSRSVDFDGSADYMTSTDNSYKPGTGDFTMECFVKHDALAMKGVFQLSSSLFAGTEGIAVMFHTLGGDNKWELYAGGSTGTESVSNTGHTTGKWVHVAIVKTGGKTKLYVEGTERVSITDTTDYSTQSYLGLGGGFGTGYTMDGHISNFKYTKGQALYTSSFRPPTTALTTTSQGSAASNVKVLCCQGSSATSATVIAASLSATGTVSASTDSPEFDDPAAYVFGDSGDKNVIKCGSFVGNGSTDGPEINLGWEPQWILYKNVDDSESWRIVDSMRGIPNGSGTNDQALYPDRNDEEEASGQQIDVTPTGFKITTSDSGVNGSGEKSIWMALRRPDGYVGKPPELGTDVFNIANYDSTLPAFNANFPVDFAFFRRKTSTYDWRTSARLIQTKYLKTNTSDAESIENDYKFDYNDGWNAQAGYANTELSWMWKRHAGFDVVTYTGNELAGRSIPHSLGVTPEMMWLKYRNPSGYNEDWAVYHKGLNGGVNPQDYAIRLDSDNPEYNNVNDWNDTAPTSTHFTIGSDGRNNRDGSNYIVMLFASVAGISKVGYYNGTGSSNHSITTGFQPRLIIIKPAHRADGYGGGWSEFDTVRGINSGNEYPMRLNYDSPEDSLNHLDCIDLDSDGFTIQSSALSFNGSNARYIYYAHA